MLEEVNILIANKEEKFAILFIDLDDFKNANDTYGHEAGDNILKTVAVRLKNNIRSKDIVSRIGGDEFIVIIRDLNDSLNTAEIGETLVKVLSDVFIYNGEAYIYWCQYRH